jgi:hypothetical protein
MVEQEGQPRANSGARGKWLVIIIVGAGIILALVAGKFTRYRTPESVPASQPQ